MTGLEITSWEPTVRFERDYKKLPNNIQERVDECLRLLCTTPIPKLLRFEKLSGYKNPNIYTIHVTGNHSHKLSFVINGSTATLRRVSTHKTIDRAP